eukprot:93712-Prymnesium_polylepis.1
MGAAVRRGARVKKGAVRVAAEAGHRWSLIGWRPSDRRRCRRASGRARAPELAPAPAAQKGGGVR